MTGDASLEGLTRRLDRLERENRWWRVVALAGACLALLVGATTPTPDEIKAKRFVVVDDSGRARVEVGQLGVAIYDGYGNVQGRLGADGFARFQ